MIENINLFMENFENFIFAARLGKHTLASTFLDNLSSWNSTFTMRKKIKKLKTFP